MRVDIQTNTTPIRAGDDVMIDFHPIWTDLGTLYYSVHLAAVVEGQLIRRTLAQSVSVFDGRFPWHVDAIGLNLQIRVRAHLPFGLTRDALSPIFSVVPSPPRVTSPERNEDLALGGSHTVKWEQDAPGPDSYRIHFSSDGGQTFPLLRQDISGSARSATVTIPGPATEDAVLRVRGIFPEFLVVQGDEDVPVHVVSHPVVRVTSPNARLVWYVGDAEAISWTASGPITSFTIQLSRDGGQSWTTLFASVDAAERQVSAPVDPPVSEFCKVRVRANWASGQVSDVSDRTFHIRARGPRD